MSRYLISRNREAEALGQQQWDVHLDGIQVHAGPTLKSAEDFVEFFDLEKVCA